jgi:hypothetical protein
LRSRGSQADVVALEPARDRRPLQLEGLAQDLIDLGLESTGSRSPISKSATTWPSFVVTVNFGIPPRSFSPMPAAACDAGCDV